jgi:hypothetical protein
LSFAATPFDPFGYLSPALLPIRTWLHRVWENKLLKWDDELSQHQLEEWSALVEQWKDATFKWPRFIGYPINNQVSLHVFSDASNIGLGVAAYLRRDGNSQLIFAKSLLTPTKLRESMPRCELQALYNAAKVATFVRRELEAPASSSQASSTFVRREPGAPAPGSQLPIQLWTDSKCCVDWLISKKLVNLFVDNRLRLIKDFPVSHVEGVQNPADLASRGCTPQELLSAKDWFKGPPWLAGSSRNFPEPKAVYIPSEEDDDLWNEKESIANQAIVMSVKVVPERFEP